MQKLNQYQQLTVEAGFWLLTSWLTKRVPGWLG